MDIGEGYTPWQDPHPGVGGVGLARAVPRERERERDVRWRGPAEVVRAGLSVLLQLVATSQSFDDLFGFGQRVGGMWRKTPLAALGPA